MSNFNPADKILLRFGRYKVGTPTTNSQPGAHTGTSRQYIPGYSDSNIVYLDTVSGNDANSGATELLAKLTYASAATAAGTTKKIRVINNGATLSTNITKPTEMKRGVSGTIGSFSSQINSWSLAATPSFGASAINSVCWARRLSTFVAVGESGKIAYSTDGNTWVQATTPSFGSTEIFSVCWSAELAIFVAVGQSGKIAYSSDANTWTQSSNAATYNYSMVSVTWGAGAGRFVCVGNDGILYSSDGVTWSDAGKPFTYTALRSICWSESLGLFVCVGNDGVIAYSQDGVTWSLANTPSFGTDTIFCVGWSDQEEKFVAAAYTTTGKIAYSTDGNTWMQAATSTLGVNDSPRCVTYSPELGIWVLGIADAVSGGKLIYSSDGDTWSNITEENFARRGICWSEGVGRFVDVGSGGVISRSSSYQISISNNIAGFSVFGASYSGTVNAYNCNFIQPNTTAALNLNACRVTESGAHISNNAQTHFGTLFEGDAYFTSAPASASAFALNCNTFAGNVYLYNSSATGYEQIRDNVIVGDFAASYAVSMPSGNIQGERSNIITAKSVSYSDPVFSDTTDYKLSRLTNGDTQDSPLCNKASYYVNEQGEPRDLGAWSEDDSTLSYGYRYAAYFNKPAGQGIKPQKVPAASADQGLDGTWDGVNEPERATEWLTLAYQAAVPMDHLTNLDLFESLTDMTCDISLAPESAAPDTAVIVNGNHAAGDIVLNIDASSTIKAGMILEISGVKYYILYTATGSSPTKLVLHKPLESAVSDNASITPQEPPADGTYQYVPQMRETPRPHSHETEYVNGLLLKFVRQYPQL